MKLCAICRNSDFLCSGCKRKLEAGEISQADIAVSRALNKVAKGADFLRAIEHKNQTILVCEKRDAKTLIGRGGKTARALSKILEKDVRIVEKSDEKAMIEDILGTRIIGINIVYGGEETRRIRVDKAYKKLRADAALLEKILHNKYEIVFE